MYNKIFYARKEIHHFKEGKIEVLCDVHSSLEMTKLYGESPYYKIKVREIKKGEKSAYWGWKDFEKKEYCMIYPHKAGTEMCFPYGPKAEEKRGKGKLVNLVIEEIEKLKG